MNSNKKRILSGILALWLLGNISYDHKESFNYEIIEQEDYFANYSNGKVYIGTKEFIDSLTDINDTDILVIDERNKKDPDIKILSSYRIMDANIRNEILEIISIYEEKYPSTWKRSITSMKVEWFVHNVLY